MSDEATIRASLQIDNGDFHYRSYPTSFQADVTGKHGPTPGSVTVSVAGIDVSLAELAVPGLCVIENQDPTNFVTFGIWDPETTKFYPLGELLPGEIYVLRLSRDLAWEYGAGTGTTGPETNTLRFRANTAACSVFIGAFAV